ncbi:hypothetical protein [Pusillimonas sp. ANT_WB101]|uniref:hypothetical protein n=1 Tax=Pusillimonas sp. ANT_WB101 TaxID=2597356 RepID=UPI0011ED8342|nr:hypothetical protein [Pusillimonas sp. ANT_WB101]KAA0910651.1 hypothetical protein FQ179_01885 [Pusillimonas sp. ANT_WB101]
MSKQTTMLEPVAYAHRDILRRGNSVERIYPEKKYGAESVSLITTDQAEAYSAARVREALESAQSILMEMYTEAIKARVPESEDEEGWNESCLERALAISDATMKVRALIK